MAIITKGESCLQINSMPQRMQMLQQLLKVPQDLSKPHYEFLPVTTSYRQQLVKEADELLAQRFISKTNHSNNTFQGNQQLQNIKNDLILLKLKGYIDPRDVSSKATQIKKLPTNVQVGYMIEGDPIEASKKRNKKKHGEFIDYYLRKDAETEYSNKKFNEIQKLKQRKRKIKKRVLMKKEKASKAGKRAQN